MLVPLETLNGWPAVTDPTPLQVLGLLIGFPLLLVAVVFGISKASAMIQASRNPDQGVAGPLWLGSHTETVLEGSQAHSAVAELENSTATAGSLRAGSETGGASARW